MSKKPAQKPSDLPDDSPIEAVQVSPKSKVSDAESEQRAKTREKAADETKQKEQAQATPVKVKTPSERYGPHWNDAQKAHFDSQQWSENDIKQYEAVVKDPKQTYLKDSTVLAFDPQRLQRPATHWNTDELSAYLEGNLLHVKSHRRDELADEYRRRVTVDAAWSHDDLQHYKRTGQAPKKTASGVWLRDVTRDKRPAAEWSIDELKAWAFGEIHTTIESRRLIEEINQRLDLSIPTSITDMRRLRKMIEDDQTRIEKTAQRIEEGKLTHMNATHIDTVMDQYIKTVRPGQEISTESAARAQNNLERLFSHVISLEGQALAEGLEKIKRKVIEERKGVFSPSNAHRFTEYVKGDATVKCRHIALIEMFMIVADPNKSRRKQTDVKSMLKDFPSDQRDRLADYFTNYA